MSSSSPRKVTEQGCSSATSGSCSPSRRPPKIERPATRSAFRFLPDEGDGFSDGRLRGIQGQRAPKEIESCSVSSLTEMGEPEEIQRVPVRASGERLQGPDRSVTLLLFESPPREFSGDVLGARVSRDSSF